MNTDSNLIAFQYLNISLGRGLQMIIEVKQPYIVDPPINPLSSS